VSFCCTRCLGVRQVRRRAWLTKLPVVRSAEPSRLVVSMAESLVARGGLKPATFVGKLWLSYKVRVRLRACGAQLRRCGRFVLM
jgi:hypothetical protein